MLDDTYVVEGNLRHFLQDVRDDQYSDSFSFIIKSDDVEYTSNRVIKSQSGLRYKFKIHEIITDNNNVNVIIPKSCAFIDDRRFDYMEDRTMKRKDLDLQLLYEEVQDDPQNPRSYYYLAQTYNLLEQHELAYFFFMKRCEFTNSGFIQERIDAAFEAARIANFKLNKPWDECLKLYETAFKIDETRPDSQYFIGIHYYLENDIHTAFTYFKKAFEIGYPEHAQYGLKPSISFHFLPKFLCKICYEMNDYKLGKAAGTLFLQKNQPGSDSYDEIVSWYKIYEKLTCDKITMIPTEQLKPNFPAKPIFCFHADGGFNKWSGSSILNTGVGGSETYIIELSRYIQKSGEFDVFVFCNCGAEENFEGVVYKPLDEYYSFIRNNYIHTCIVSRFSEYLPVTFKGFVENVYLVCHDLTPSGIVIPIDKKLKKVFCQTEWHVEYFTNIFTSLKDITFPFYNGIDFTKFKVDNVVMKEDYKFIYSSFPNRGLLQLLQMWPKIYEFQPLASLHIYCDINGEWVNRVEEKMMLEIKQLFIKYCSSENNTNMKNTNMKNMNIHYYGWVNKQTLAEAWRTADIWIYPCTFMETFCITALEAALTKTLVITNDLAGLQNTVADRGVIIKGDAKDIAWQDSALRKIKYYLDPKNVNAKNAFIEKNYEWALELSWENQAKRLLGAHVLKENLEYKGKYNWTNNFPSVQEKNHFLNLLTNFCVNFSLKQHDRTIQVLEIGSQTGTSLIKLLEHIPNSVGFAIDKWDDSHEIENSFLKNVILSGLQKRIYQNKGDPKIALFKMGKTYKVFDFIHVNSSGSVSDFYVELFLSWQLLNKGGVMVFNTSIKSSHDVINKFLSENKHEIHVLYSGYNIFLQKNLR